MKVLFLQNIEGIAGSEKYFLALIPELIKKGIACEIFCVHPVHKKEEAAKFYKLLEESNIPYHVLETKKYYSLKIPKAIGSYSKKAKVDIVHCHLIYADFWGSLVKLLFNKKVKIISTKHGYHEDTYVKFCNKPENLPKNLYYHLFKFTHRHIDKSYACSYGLRDFYLKASLIEPGSMEVIQHGFDYPEVDLSDRENYRFGELQLIVVGRLVERKGHKLLLQIMPELVKKHPGIKLVILGNGELEEELKKYTVELGLLEHVLFLGFKYEVDKYLGASDIAVFPSYSEGLPLVLFEAFNAKVPVVSFDSIGCDELIENGVNGLKAKSFELDQLMDCVERFIGDKDLRKTCAENAWLKLKNYYTLERMATETVDFYNETLS